MKYTKKNGTDYTVEYNIEVDQEDLKDSHQAAVKRLGRDAKVSGFRKGHIPFEVLERTIDPNRLASLEIDDAINKAMVELIDIEDIQMMEQPQVEIVKYVPNDTLEIKAKIQSVPEVKLADASKLKVAKPVTKVEESQIDDVIGRLRHSLAKKELVDRAAKKDDEVSIDFVGLKDGVEFDGGKAKDYSLVLGSKTFIPGFEEGIIGHKAGEEFDVKVTFPKDYGASNLAGQKAVFKITLKKIYELKLPEVNDSFAKSVSADLKTVKALREDVKRELSRQAEASNRETYRLELVDKLASKSKIDLPELLVERQVASQKQKFIQDLTYRGSSLENYLEQIGKTAEQWEKEDLRSMAEKQIKRSMVLRQVMRDFKIKVTDDDIDQHIEGILAMYNNPSMRDNFKSPEARQRFKDELLAERAIDKIIKLNESK